MRKFIVSTLMVLLFSVAIAQTFIGAGEDETQLFQAKQPWAATVLASPDTKIYLYDASTEQRIRLLVDGQENTETGTFYLSVESTDSWIIDIVGEDVQEVDELQASGPQPVPLEIDDRPIEVSLNDYIDAQSGFGEQRYNRDRILFEDYDCSDFPSSAAAQRFFQSNGGPRADRYGLDRDGDGFACEWDPRQVYRQQNRPSTTSQSSSGPCGPGRHWVSGYTRSNGTRVSGYCRRN